MKVYVNGQEVGTGAPPAALFDNDHDVSIGARKNTGSEAYGLNFAGLIDEVAIYSRALSAGEVQANYNAAQVPEPSSAVLTLAGLLSASIGVRRRRSSNAGAAPQ
jgi:hypothetical protein